MRNDRIVAFVSYALILTIYLLSVSTNQWIVASEFMNRSYIIQNLGLWKVCWQKVNEHCEESTQGIMLHIHEDHLETANWILTARFFAINASIFISCGVIISLNAVVNSNNEQSPAGFILMAISQMVTSLSIFTYYITDLLDDLKWGPIYILSWCASCLGFIVSVGLICWHRFSCKSGNLAEINGRPRGETIKHML